MAIKRINPKINDTELGELIVDTKRKTVVAPCPKCGKFDQVYEILYGYLDLGGYDEKRYVPGGCMPRDEQYYCERDELEF